MLDGGGPEIRVLENIMNVMSYLEVVLQLFFFLLCMMCVYGYVHQRVYNLAAVGKGNWELQKAVAKVKKLGGEANAS